MDVRFSVNRETTKMLTRFLANLGERKGFLGMAKKVRKGNINKLVNVIRKQESVSVIFCTQRIVMSFNA